MAQLERVQVMLEARQRKALRSIARKERRSMSEVLRELFDKGLAQKQSESEEWKGALERLRQIREQARPYEGNIIADVRAERDEQLERVQREWRKSS